jgi:hypothetical protein
MLGGISVLKTRAMSARAIGVPAAAAASMTACRDGWRGVALLSRIARNCNGRNEACAPARVVPRCRAGRDRAASIDRHRHPTWRLQAPLRCTHSCPFCLLALLKLHRTMALLVMLLSLLLTAAISVVLLPKSLHLLAELAGRRLRHSSRTRRELLLDRVAAETRAFEAEDSTKSREDDDWEKIVPSPIGSAGSVGQAGAEWNGIVGFFHPFWWVVKLDIYILPLLT